MSTNLTKHRFYQTECLLYAYRGAIQTIREEEEYIVFLEKYGLPKISKSFVGAAKVDISRDILQEKIDTLRESIEFMQCRANTRDFSHEIQPDIYFTKKNIISIKYVL